MMALCAVTSLMGLVTPGERLELLQLVQSDKIKEWCTQYTKLSARERHPHLLQECCLLLLHGELTSEDPLRNRLALLCAISADHECVLPLFDEALEHSDPALQLLAMTAMCQYQSSQRAEKALLKLAHSPYLILRLEALRLMAQGGYSCALTHIDALQKKLGENTPPFFAELYAAVGSEQAGRALRRLLIHPSIDVRLAAIHAATQTRLRELLPALITVSTQTNNVLQEACAYALGVFGDEGAVPALKRLCRSHCEEVALAAWQGLYRYCDSDAASVIATQAERGDLYAIQLLAQHEEQNELLIKLTTNKDELIRANAALALLKKGDSRGLPQVQALLLGSRQPLLKSFSPGHSLFAYKYALPLMHPGNDASVQEEQWLTTRESWLTYADKLPSKDFLTLAGALLEGGPRELIPHLIALIATHLTDEREAFLQRYVESPGAPLVRYYCHLALLEGREEAADRSRRQLQRWIEQNWDSDFVAFRPMVDPACAMAREKSAEIRPRVTMRLFLTALDMLSRRHDEACRDWLIKGLTSCHPRLRSAFAALLMRNQALG